MIRIAWPEAIRSAATAGREEGSNMQQPSCRVARRYFDRFDSHDSLHAPSVVREILAFERRREAGDILFRPTKRGLELRHRVDVVRPSRANSLCACDAVCAGQTSPDEVRRVLGFGPVGWAPPTTNDP
jgi:hypothetical protein